MILQLGFLEEMTKNVLLHRYEEIYTCEDLVWEAFVSSDEES